METKLLRFQLGYFDNPSYLLHIESSHEANSGFSGDQPCENDTVIQRLGNKSLPALSAVLWCTAKASGLTDWASVTQLTAVADFDLFLVPFTVSLLSGRYQASFSGDIAAGAWSRPLIICAKVKICGDVPPPYVPMTQWLIKHRSVLGNPLLFYRSVKLERWWSKKQRRPATRHDGAWGRGGIYKWVRDCSRPRLPQQQSLLRNWSWNLSK
jgi:hypothetical protein